MYTQAKDVKLLRWLTNINNYNMMQYMTIDMAYDIRKISVLYNHLLNKLWDYLKYDVEK